MTKKKSEQTRTDSLQAYYPSIYYGLILFMLVILGIMAAQSGINGDESFQVDYSKKLIDYYSGKNNDAEFIEKGQMHLYGGMFDLITGLMNNALGYDEFDGAYHSVRHIFVSIFGVLTIFFVGLWARAIAGWRAAILAALMMFLSPRFFGHSLINPKDIPFAAGFAMSLYFMTVYFKHLPRANYKAMGGIAVGMAIALATRAGGLLIPAYLFLFTGIHFLTNYGFKGFQTRLKTGFIHLGYALGISVMGYFLGILFWPAALAEPFTYPFKALSEFSKFGTNLRVLFMGENIMSDDIPWHYGLSWIGKTLPLFTLVGILGAIAFSVEIMKKYRGVGFDLALFASFFPVIYIMLRESALHDGWRHLIFIYSGVVVASAVFYVYLEGVLAKKKTWKYVLWSVLGLLMLESSIFIIRNSAYPYVYFNPVAGGVKSIFGYYETDYWGISTKQAIDWLEEKGHISPTMEDTVVIGTTFYYPVDRLTRKRFNGKVKTVYVRFNQRYQKAWDFGIFPSRFIRSGQLLAGAWPNSKTVKVFTADHVPILAIEEDRYKYTFIGEKSIDQRDFATAVENFGREVQRHPDNEQAWLGLANSYVKIEQPDKAIEAATQALRIAPRTESALYFLGVGHFLKGELDIAMQIFQETLRVNDDLAIAYYYLAVIFKERKELELAVNYGKEAIRKEPRFKQAYMLVADIYLDMKDYERAEKFRRAAAKFDDVIK